jgi:homoserine kinase
VHRDTLRATMRVTVRVPATAANLGPGFDCFGLALDLCDEVSVDTEGPAGVRWEGEGSGELPIDGADLIGRVMAAVAGRMSLPIAPHDRLARNRIPLARGLGSSSAATVAGIVLTSVLLDLGIHEDPTSVFAIAAEIEGHPDNAAAAAFGGFTIALPDGGVRRLDPHPALRPAVLVPDLRTSTSEARTALPDRVPRADAVSNIAHAALAVEALTRDPSLLPAALVDRLHEDIRLRAVPEVADVVAELRRSHVPVCVSGSGPSLLAFERDDRPPLDLASLGASSWRILRPGVRMTGYEVEAR